MAGVAVAALELYRLDADREREVARREVAVLRRLVPRLNCVVELALQHKIPLATELNCLNRRTEAVFALAVSLDRIKQTIF